MSHLMDRRELGIHEQQDGHADNMGSATVGPPPRSSPTHRPVQGPRGSTHGKSTEEGVH